MNHPKRILVILAASLLGLGAVGVAFSDDDDDDDRHGKRGERGGWVTSGADVAPVTNATYGQECGSCHLAYQPGLLPADAWARVMDPAALGNHYGDDASLTDDLSQEIGAYLIANAADQAEQTRARAFAVASGAKGSRQGAVLPRITETRYFVRQHDEIPARLVTGNPEVGSFSQCNTCHRGAADGVYNEHQVSIPGHGRWED
ncbi:cytochrome C [Thiocystis minor]|uniref:diheme cytochrome c n=1 Tax=Thiocystis minor TaxID=61597 RepID=UPI001912020D|nr:diheme cytochrome c [Thiocystis minor]MBK5963953.1 cytochrome C [Thiocystis minor]